MVLREKRDRRVADMAWRTSRRETPFTSPSVDRSGEVLGSDFSGGGGTALHASASARSWGSESSPPSAECM